MTDYVPSYSSLNLGYMSKDKDKVIANKAIELAIKTHFHLTVDAPVNLLGVTYGDIELRCNRCNTELRGIDLKNIEKVIRSFKHEKGCIVTYIQDIYEASNEPPRNTP